MWLLAALVLTGLALPARAVAPVAPSNCVACTYNPTATTATINISWNDNSTTETQWDIQYSINGGSYGPFYTMLTSNGPGTTGTGAGTVGVSWSGAALNTVYHFMVKATNGSGSSAPSNVATVGTYDLNSPINLSVTALDPFNVIMSWEEGSTSETGFAIEEKVGIGSWAYLGTLGANTLSVSPSRLIAPLETYLFRVRAFKGSAPSTPDSPSGANVSPYSNVVSLTGGAYTLTASAVPGHTLINLSWPNVLYEAGYQVFYLAADAPPGTQPSWLVSLGADVTTYQVASPAIEPAKTYSFTVKPHDGSNFFGVSSVASATVDGITSKTGTSGTPGSAFAHTFTQVSAAAVSSRSLTGLPSGLVFTSGTGDLSGVYPAVGNYTLNYTVSLANGGTLTQPFYIRVRPAAGAPVVGTLIPAWTGAAGVSRDTPLAGTFTDVEADSAVRVTTTLGTMDFILFNAATPATVTNFMSYVSSGKWRC